RGVGRKVLTLEIAQVALRLLQIRAFSGPGCGKGCKLLDPFFRQVDSRSQRRFLVRCIIELIVRAPQRGLGGFYRSFEGHRVDLEQHVAFLNRPVWFNRHPGNPTGYARNGRDHVVHRAHVVSCRRADVQKEEKSHHCHDGQRDGDHLGGKIPGQPLEFKENEPDEEPVDAKQDDFHYTFPPLTSVSSSAMRARSCSSSLVAGFSPCRFPCESSTSVP